MGGLTVVAAALMVLPTTSAGAQMPNSISSEGSAAGAPVPTPTSSHAAGAAVTEPGHPTTPGPHCNLDPTDCLLPFPDDWWTQPDSHTVTGRRVDLPQSAMPTDQVGVPVDATPYQSLDGFSPGATILIHVPGLDTEAAFEHSGIVSEGDMSAYADPDQPVVVYDAATGQRWPIWVEVDVTAGSPDDTLLMIHPSVDFAPDTRYIVALRNLPTVTGAPIPAPADFEQYVTGTAPKSDPRASHMRELLFELAAAGVAPSSLYMAWDFTVASSQDMTDSLLSMRNQTFAQLGDTDLGSGTISGHAPVVTVESVQNRTVSQDPDIARQVVLNVTVPCYIFPTCSLTPTIATTPGGPLAPLIGAADQADPSLKLSEGTPDIGTGVFLKKDPLSPYATPLQNPISYQARVVCNIPRAAYTTPARISLYGHGLLGTPFEVDAADVETQSETHDILFCATDWLGMAEGDIPNVVLSLFDLSNFPTLIDRVEQGILDQMVVGQALVAQGGLFTNPLFESSSGHPLYDASHLYYDGNSMGGIYGATLMALEPDIRRGVLGVPGMDFSLLIYRSSDYGNQLGSFGLDTAYDWAYPSPVTRLVGLDLVQMLWDRADPDGFITHLTTDPLPDTPTHTVLLQVAYGDHQVANVVTETEARSAGIPLVWPALVSGRSPDPEPFWGLTHLTTFPSDGSAMVIFDSGPVRTVNGQLEGTAPPPDTDTPPTSGVDPHESPRDAPCGQQQKAAFLEPDGTVTATCGGSPYSSPGGVIPGESVGLFGG
jgi:hypothetical protein